MKVRVHCSEAREALGKVVLEVVLEVGEMSPKMGSMTFRPEGCALASLLAALAIAACGSGEGVGSTSERDGGHDDGSQSAGPSDASASPQLQSPGIDVVLPSATAFADVNVDADFTQPVDLPPPATTIAGDSASLLGSWVELAPDGSVCTPATAPNRTCFHLDIRKDGAGAVEGTIYEDPLDPARGGAGLIVGPFPPATDPSVGYPSNLSPGDQLFCEGVVPKVDYRLLDGVVNSGTFTFWYSALDLWSGWCALQTPYAWNVGGVTKYRCVPQTATPANTDAGKFDLCTSAYDGPQCTDSMGFAYQCVCLDRDGGSYNASLPGCEAGAGPVCECFATQCRANLRGGQTGATLAFEGGKLVGSFQIGPAVDLMPALAVTFRRATP
jgi:hypothetical protein